jgi:RNA ligase (TIGR02306 family)
MGDEKPVRVLASVQRILDVAPIPNADRIERATVLGWQLVVHKNEFKSGDLCLYTEIDSILPFRPWTEFLRNKDNPDKPIRLRSQTMRGQISQGLAMPLQSIPELNYDVVGGTVVIGSEVVPAKEGLDLTETLRIEKYEAPIPVCLAGEMRGARPGKIPITDEPRVQSFPGLIKEFDGLEVYWTVKADGSSGTFANLEDGDHHVCSRNISLRDNEGNVFWKMYRKYSMKDILDANPWMAVQGEVAGPKIEDNRMGLKDHDLFVFNVYDIRAGRYLDYKDFMDFCRRHSLNPVEVEKVEIFRHTVEEMVEFAQTCRYPNGELGEGYVIRPTVEARSQVLGGRRLSMKVVSNAYLIKHGKDKR